MVEYLYKYAVVFQALSGSKMLDHVYESGTRLKISGHKKIPRWNNS